MNRHERDDLLKFMQPLLRTRATDKDFAAETLILEHCARQPDALYLLVQRAMALESALRAAQARIAQLQGPPQAQPGSQGSGLLTQASAVGMGVGLGVTAGVVAGGLLLDALGDGLSGEL